MLFILVIMLFIDYFYLKLISSSFKKMVKNIQNKKMELNYLGAFYSYFFLSFSLYYFIILPNKSLLDAFLLGLSIYGVFDGTNLAIFTNYQLDLSIIDTIWGGLLYFLTTYIYRTIL
jgi:uncharacterized membrane protein